MSNALKHQRGFSLPETVLAMALMVAASPSSCGQPYADIDAKMCQHHGNDQYARCQAGADDPAALPG